MTSTSFFITLHDLITTGSLKNCNRNQTTDNTGVEFATMSGSESEPLSALTKEERLRIAMRFTDVIRRHEAAAVLQSSSAIPTVDTLKKNDPLKPLRTFLETPGVKQGFMVVTVCLGVFVPVRRILLRVADQQWKLGTIFPDLLVTPIMAVTTAQCSLWAGSVYGSADYLHRLADTAATTHLSSPTVDAICNDPAVDETATGQSRRFDVEHTNSFTNSTLRNSWDPREQTIYALERALKACLERRESKDNFARSMDDEE
jgi:hypothetical protein